MRRAPGDKELLIKIASMFATQPEHQHTEIDADNVVASSTGADAARDVLDRSGDSHVRVATLIGLRKIEVSNPTPV